MVWIWIGIGILVSLPITVALLLVVLFLYLRVNYMHHIERIIQEQPIFVVPRGQARADAEDVTFVSADGLQLRGCYLKTPLNRCGVVLFAPEFGSNRWSCLQYCEHLVEAGYDVFAYEPRNQGDSDAEPGLEPMHWSVDRDVTDMQGALAYLKGRPDADPRGVGLFGISKGAGAGILTAMNEPAIRCAVTDGMFGARSVIVPYMRHWITIYNKSYLIQGLLPSWYYGLLALWALHRVGRARKVKFLHLERAMGRFRRPLLMFHGQRDSYIRPDMAKTLFDLAGQPKDLWLIPGAAHNQGLHVAGEEYRRRTREFFDRYLAAQG